MNNGKILLLFSPYIDLQLTFINELVMSLILHTCQVAIVKTCCLNAHDVCTCN